MTPKRGARTRAILGLLALVLAACGTAGEATTKNVPLGGDVVARVGSVTIERDLVARVASAQHVTPRAALDALIEDALFAEGARARSLDATPRVKFALDRARARWVADQIQSHAVARGLPSDEEVDKLTARHWQAFDAPPGVRTIHAAVLRKKGASNDDAKAVADAIALAVHDAPDDKEFSRLADAVPKNGFDVRIEYLPVFAADGRVLDGNGAMDATFAASAFALDDQHRLSPVVETSFGWHVILLLQRVPEKRVPLEERRRTFADEAIFLRGKSEKDAIVSSYRKGTTVVIDPAAEALMAGVVAGGP